MNAAERLAALLAGDLDADERDALEAELSRDATLRADLDAMRRADDQLRTLRSPTSSAGFDRRLDAALGAVLDEVLGVTDARQVAGDDARELERHGSSATVVPADALAARRRDRNARRLRALAGVAAGAVVLAGSGVALTQLLDTGGDDTASDQAVVGDEEAFSMDTEAAEDSADAGRSSLDAPIVVAEGRTFTDEDLDALLDGGELDSVRSNGFDRTSGRELADRLRSAFGIHAPEAGDSAAMTEDSATDGTEAAPEALSPTTPELFTRDGARLPQEAAGDVARCLGELLADAPDAIPVYAELGSYQGADVIVFGLVTIAPETDTFSRTEVWVLDRASCRTLRLSQG